MEVCASVVVGSGAGDGGRGRAETRSCDFASDGAPTLAVHQLYGNNVYSALVLIRSWTLTLRLTPWN